MPPVGFEPTISAGERSQAYALDRAATEIGYFQLTFVFEMSHSAINLRMTMNDTSEGIWMDAMVAYFVLPEDGRHRLQIYQSLQFDYYIPGKVSCIKANFDRRFLLLLFLLLQSLSSSLSSSLSYYLQVDFS